MYIRCFLHKMDSVHFIRINPAMIFFTNAYGKPIKQKLLTIRQYTEYSAYIRIIPDAFIKWLTSEDNRILIQFIFNEKIKYPLDLAIEFIEDLEKAQRARVKIKL